MLKVNPVSFGGSVVRRTYLGKDEFEPKITKKEMIESYEKPVKKLESYKQFAIKLDDLMHKDSDVKKKLKELPRDVQIDLFEDFTGEPNPDKKSRIDMFDPILSVSSETLSKKGIELDDCSETCVLEVPYNKKGPDKKMILNWLDDLKVFNDKA